MRWILMLGLVCASLVASEQSEKDYQKAVDQAKAEFDAKVTAAKTKFVVTLKAEMDAATKKGDLDGALALRTKINDLEPKKEVKKEFSGDVHWISKEATYTTSSEHGAFPASPKLLDGTGDAYNTTGSTFSFATNEEESPYIVIDLGETHQITGIEILNRKMFEKRSATLTMWVSDDQKTWVETWRTTEAKLKLEVPIEKTQGRFVKFGLREKNILNLSMIKIFGR